jgi:hypothetical protein
VPDLGAELLIVWMIFPGALIVAALIALTFGLWSKFLGDASARYRRRALANGYLAAGLGLLACSFITANMQFNSMSQWLIEKERWSKVSGYMLLNVLVGLWLGPLLILITLPGIGFLLRTKRLNLSSITLVLLALWFCLTLLSWAFPQNDWHLTHRLESLKMWLASMFWPVALIAGPFLLAVKYTQPLSSLERADDLSKL